MTSWTPRGVAATLALVVAGCSPPAAAPPSTMTTRTTTARAPTVARSAAPTAQVASSATAPTPDPPAPPPSPVVAFPPKPVPVKVVPTHDYWAVYLATFDAKDDAYRMTLAAWNATKLPVGSGEVSCDRGAKDAGIAGAWEIAVYFVTEADARAFSAAVSPKTAGVAKVSIGCAD